ncbi:MAG: Do family serine endopeptidase [Pseudomonadota bacterium]
MVSACLRAAGLALVVALTVLPVLPAKAHGGIDGATTIAPMLNQVTPAVVNISVETSQPSQGNPLFRDPFFRRFFEQPRDLPQRRGMSAGSGVIVDAGRGYVLTNNHVVRNARRITVTLKDGRRMSAKFIGGDTGTDIAVLQIAAENLTDIALGDSEALQVGDFVVAIGNPFGLGQTVTSGIVSALGRSGINPRGYEDFIQTDASINPGNSGGALVTYDGQLVGINTAIVAPAGGNVGIGFAVPIAMAKDVMDQILANGEVVRGWLGVTIQDLTPDLAEAMDLGPARGALVANVQGGSPADRAQLAQGDVIVQVNGRSIDGASDLRNAIGLAAPGAEAALLVLRDGGERELDVTLGRQPQTR